MLPWIILALVAVPLLVAAFVAARRRTAAGERPLDDHEQQVETDEFAAAEAYEAEWREKDKERFHRERLP